VARIYFILRDPIQMTIKSRQTAGVEIQLCLASLADRQVSYLFPDKRRGCDAAPRFVQTRFSDLVLTPVINH